MDDGLSEWILELHRDARALRSEAFCERMFERLQTRMPFDSGLLYRGARRGGVVEFHAYYLFRQPPALLERYMAEELWRVDPFVEWVLTRPGVALRLARVDCPPRFQPFLEDNGQRQMISLAVASDALQLVAGLALYRRDAQHAFSDAEAREYEDIVPHAVDGWTHSWLGELVRTDDEREAPFAIAVLTPDTTLTAAQRELESLMALDWPDWKGPSMPATLRDHILGRPGTPWYGPRLAIYVEPIDGGRYLLRIRVRHAFDALAPRKQAVALAFAAGASQSQVAKDLHLSASTVNNYLGDVYRELQISDKVQLALLVSRLRPTSALH
jgi:DNA-binding CsgD family transcriptional regulator